MGVSRLKRKDRRNKTVATNRQDKIKELMKRPKIKNVDMEAIKADFAAKLATAK
jgi:hypothetical protein